MRRIIIVSNSYVNRIIMIRLIQYETANYGGSSFVLWGRVVMDVRKIFEETEEYVYIPDLSRYTNL